MLKMNNPKRTPKVIIAPITPATPRLISLPEREPAEEVDDELSPAPELDAQIPVLFPHV
jgi:hypothetical protein